MSNALNAQAFNLSGFQLEGKVALITGASSGFGNHFARVIAEAGAKVVVGARREDKLQTLVNDIKASGGDALAVAMDVTQVDSVAAAFDAAEQAFGTVNVLINNAGVAVPKWCTKPAKPIGTLSSIPI